MHFYEFKIFLLFCSQLTRPVMYIRILLLCIAGIVIRNPASAQPLIEKHADIAEVLAESMEGYEDASPDYESILEDLEYLYEHPMNLNTATFSDMQKLPFLTDFQIRSLLDYRNENGVLLSLYELQLVHGFAVETISKMLPYVTVEKPVQTVMPYGLRNVSKYGKGEITLSARRAIEKPSGYTIIDSCSGTTVYPGDPWHYYAKAGFHYGNKIDFGATMEKDPGESFFSRSNRNGFDFYSAHLMVGDMGFLKTIVVGDYRLQFGQGLTLWNGYSPGKSSLPLNVVKRYSAIRKYTSTEENNFFRGIAASLGLGKFIFTGFYSSKRNDANITDTLDSDMPAFSSFQYSGYHRTRSEIADEKSVHVRSFGSNLTYRGDNLKMGLTFINYRFDSYLQQSDEPYKAFDFSGSSLVNAGLDYILTLRNIQLAGEVSYGHQAFATLHTAVFNASKYASVALLFRYFPPSYYAMHSAAFSEGSGDNNESGLYLGTVIHPLPHWTLSAYADFYRFPWLRYHVNAPSSGKDYMAMIGFQPGKNVEMSLRFRSESKQINSSSNEKYIEELVWSNYMGLRYHFTYKYNDALQLQMRTEYVSVKTEEKTPERGFMLYQDVVYRFRKIPAILYFRYAWFETDNYSSRIYMYEQQTLSSFTSTSLYDEGYRTYIMFRYNFAERVSCWARLSRTSYSEKTTISSGYDQIFSSARHEVKFQVVIRF